MADKVILRNDTTENWNKCNPILSTGEIGIEIDGTNRYKIGDGIHHWNELPYPVTDVKIVQKIGNDSTAVMSQDAVTREIKDIQVKVDNEINEQENKLETTLNSQNNKIETTLNSQDKKINDFQKTIENQINNYKPVNIQGNVNNAADEEDLTAVNGLLQLKDRNTFNGMGYIILRRDKTFTEQLTQTNTIYEIRYDFDLNGKEVEIPENCVLKFEGGSLSNGIINCLNTYIDGCLNCLPKSLSIKGIVINELKLSWLGVYGNNDNNVDNIKSMDRVEYPNRSFALDSNIILAEGDISFPTHTNLNGNGHIIEYTCSNASKGLIIISDYSKIEKLKIIPINPDYDGVVILADTRVREIQPHQFSFDNILVNGYYCGKKPIGLKIIASNEEDNNNHYITGCNFTGLRLENLKIGIEIVCKNINYTESKDFAWLNQLYFDNLFISSTNLGILTCYTDTATNNKSNSCGPVYFHNFEYQSLNQEALMFSHCGSWRLYITTGFSYDNFYIGEIRDSGEVYLKDILGGYIDNDGERTENGETYNLVNSVKIFKGRLYNNSGLLKNIDTYRTKSYNKMSGSPLWTQGSAGDSFELSHGVDIPDYNYIRKNSYAYNDKVFTERFYTNSAKQYAQYMISESKGYGVINANFAENKGINYNYSLFGIKRNPSNRSRSSLVLIDCKANSELYLISSTNSFEKDVFYKGKIKIKFIIDGVICDYKTYNEIYPNRLNTNYLDSVKASIIDISDSYYLKTDSDLYIVWEGKALKTANYCEFYFSMQYSRNIDINNDIYFKETKDTNHVILDVKEDWFAFDAELSIENQYTTKGIERPTNIEIGFQYFDTTLKKPIWWNGTAWVDAIGNNVDETSE